VQCACCGLVARRAALEETEFHRQSLPAVRHLAPGRCAPAEWVLVCPDCGAVEPFIPALRCAECLERPCVCDRQEDGDDVTAEAQRAPRGTAG